jgi:hypothetical protein
VELSIIIVSWNVCNEVISCISSIYKNHPVCEYEIILVDNNSNDNTISIIEKKFPKINVISNTKNLGFAAANNIGCKNACGNYFLFLNPDTIVKPDALDLLVQYMEANPEVGLCGPQILNDNNSVQRSAKRFPSFRGIFYRFTILKYLRVFRRDFRYWLMYDFDHKITKNVDQLIGAAIIAKSSLIKQLNGFDQRFFMYYEEVDLCLRVKKEGFKVIFYAKPQIIHLGGHSAEQIPAKTRAMNLKSLILFMKKHKTALSDKILIFLFKIGILSRQIFEIVIFCIATILTVYNISRAQKNLRRVWTSLVFVVKYYVKILFA